MRIPSIADKGNSDLWAEAQAFGNGVCVEQ